MKEKQSVWESIRFARALDSRKLKKRFIGAGTQPPKGNVFVYFGNDANNFVRHAKMKLLFTDQAEYYAVCLDCYFAHSDQQWSGSTNQPGWRDRSARYLEKHITNKGWCQFCDPVFGNGGWYRG